MELTGCTSQDGVIGDECLTNRQCESLVKTRTNTCLSYASAVAQNRYRTRSVTQTIGCPKVRVEIFALARGARACIESTRFIIMTVIIIN